MIKMLFMIFCMCVTIQAKEKLTYNIKDSNMDAVPINGKEIFQFQKGGFYRYLDADKLYVAIIYTNEQGETIRAEMQSGDKKTIFTVQDGKLLYDNEELDLKTYPLISFPEVQLKVNKLNDNAVYTYYTISTDTLKPYRIIIKKLGSDDSNTTIQITRKGFIPSITRWVYKFRKNTTEAFQKSGYFLSGSWYYESNLE